MKITLPIKKILDIYKERGTILTLFSPIESLINRILDFILKDNINKLKLNAIDVYERYSEVSKEIDISSMLLEVGGNNSYLQHFVNNKVTFVDKEFDRKFLRRNKDHYFVVANAMMLPFKNNKFEGVISTATLEHIPKRHRISFTGEIKRVTSRKAIIYCPYGKNGERYDRKLYRLRSLLGINDKWTEEHIKYGLPGLDDLKCFFPKSEIKCIQNGDVWLSHMFLSSLPVIGRMLPGIVFSFMKHKNKDEPLIGGIVVFERGKG